MNAAISQIFQKLSRLDKPIIFFIRDDDAGWQNSRLLALLDITQKLGVPIDLAAIPSEMDRCLSKEIARRVDQSSGLIGLHQHGYAHTNHEVEGRACEFGERRNDIAQSQDIQRGHRMLQDRFGSKLDLIFTPPWNRCAKFTPRILADLGFSAISRNRNAEPQDSLFEIAVDIDWCKQLRKAGHEAAIQALACAINARILDGLPLGLMLHHATMSAQDMSQLEDLISALHEHPNIHWRLMRELMGSSTSTPRTSLCRPTEGHHETSH